MTPIFIFGTALTLGKYDTSFGIWQSVWLEADADSNTPGVTVQEMGCLDLGKLQKLRNIDG